MPGPPLAGAATLAVSVTGSLLDAPWSATSDRAWLAVAPASGIGSGTVLFTATRNDSTLPRTATVTVAGRPVIVTQAGGVASFGVTPGTWAAPAAGATLPVTIGSSLADAAWTTASDQAWLTVTPNVGVGSATVTLVAAPATSTRSRTAVVTIAGHALSVTQAGASASFVVAPAAWAAPAAGATLPVAITSSVGDAPWTARSDQGWLTVSSSAGAGSATLMLTASAAVSTVPRTATVTVAGQPISVTQAGASASFVVAPAAWAAPAGGATLPVAITSSVGDAPWTARSDQGWLTVSPANGIGSGAAMLTAAPAVSALPRTASVTIAGSTVVVTQAAATPTFSVTPAAFRAPVRGGAQVVTVTPSLTGATWAASTHAPWLSVSPAGGQGTGAVTVAVAPAANEQARTGTLTIAGQTVTVTQAGRRPFTRISESAWTAPSGGGSTAIDLDVSESADTWQASSDVPWLTVNPARGSGKGRVTISAMPSGAAGLAAARVDSSVLDTPDGAATVVVSQFHAGSVRTGTVVFAPIAPSEGHTRHLAEGATSSIFDTRLALLNPGAVETTAMLSFLRAGLPPIDYPLVLPPRRRVTLWPRSIAGLEAAEFSTTVTAPVPLVVDRTMTWDDTAYGAHAETAAASAAPVWYLAEGATHSGFALFYLLQNPGDTATTVRVRYLRTSGPPLEKDYPLAARSRMNIWVNVEEFAGLGQALASDEFGAVVSSLDQTPIIVERAMYRSTPGRPFDAGHESMGVSTPSTRWFMAEGRTGPFFDQFVLIANPTDAPADVRVTYLLDNGQTYARTMVAPANARSGIWVDYDQIPGVPGHPLEDVALSTTVESLNGVPLVVERTMWWPGDGSTWHEAHNSSGAIETGTTWALADGEVGGSRNAQTYVLIANTSAYAGRARVTVLFEDGSSREAIYPLLAQSRANAAIGPDFGPAVEGRRFSVLVEALGVSDDEPAPQIVVERAMYSDAGGVALAAGTNAVATRLR